MAMNNDHLKQHLIVNEGYTDLKEFEDGSIAGIFKFIFTYAIIYDMDYYGYGDRWCYKTYNGALKALEQWNGEGEPKGWHRHPSTGRRVDDQGNEYVSL